jgi:hypothetical protein
LNNEILQELLENNNDAKIQNNNIENDELELFSNNQNHEVVL